MFVTKEKGTREYNVYKVSYLADAPFDVAWKCTNSLAEWLASTESISNINATEIESTDEQLGERTFFVEWKDGSVQTMQVRWQLQLGLIDVTVDQGAVGRGGNNGASARAVHAGGQADIRR